MSCVDEEYVRSQVLPCGTLADLTPAPPLDELPATTRFRITHVDKTDFGVYHVVQKSAWEDELFRLREEIVEVLAVKDLKVEELPRVGQVLLAPHPDQKEEYQRAVVEKLHLAPENLWETGGTNSLDESWVSLYFFDMGGSHKVEMDKLKPITKAMLEFPVLSYKVRLYNKISTDDEKVLTPFRDEGLILHRQLESLMEPAMRMDVVLHVEKGEMLSPLELQKLVTPIYPVVLHFTLKGKRQPVTKHLDKLKMWDWETLFLNHHRYSKVDDRFIVENGVFGVLEENTLEWSAFKFLPNTEFTGQVTRVVGEKTGELRLILLDDPVSKNNLRVLQTQVDRYCEKVGSSLFNPGIGTTVFLFKLDQKLEYEKMGIGELLGKWCRALKMDAQWIYLLDWDVNVPLDGLEPNDYEMREMYGEFLQIPSLQVFIQPFENGVQIPKKRAEALFVTKKRYRFRVRKEAPSDDDVFPADYLGKVENQNEKKNDGFEDEE